jgi:hypothetical protein
MKITTVYKITTKDCKSALSLGSHWVPELTVQYSTDNWAVPNNLSGFSGPLMAFNSLDRASRFFNLHMDRNTYVGQWVIWEAQAINARKKTRVLRLNSSFCINLIKSFWRGFSKSNIKHKNYEKNGFLTCDAIKLVKLVDPLPITYEDPDARL